MQELQELGHHGLIDPEEDQQESGTTTRPSRPRKRSVSLSAREGFADLLEQKGAMKQQARESSFQPGGKTFQKVEQPFQGEEEVVDELEESIHFGTEKRESLEVLETKKSVAERVNLRS